MSLDFVSEVWEALRTHIDFNERREAADTLINLLIDHNYEADEIKDAFRSDKDVLTSLKDYVSEHESEYEEYEEDEDQDEEWD